MEIYPYLIAGAALAGGLVAGALAEEVRKRIRRKLFKPMFDALDDRIHYTFDKNLDLLSELFGDTRTMHQVVGNEIPVLEGPYPDDYVAARSLSNLFAKDEIEPAQSTELHSVQVDEACIYVGGASSNRFTRRLLGYLGQPDYLLRYEDAGIRFRPVSNIEKYPEIRSMVKHYLPTPSKDIQSFYSVIWRDSENQYPDFQVSPDKNGFQEFDFLKITKLRKSVVVDGLHGLGTRAIKLLFSNRKVLQETIGELQRKSMINLPFASYEAIYFVEVKHDHGKCESEPVGIHFKIAEPIKAKANY